MTNAELFYIVFLALLGGVVSFFVCPTRRDAVNVAIFFQISFWFRAILVGLNHVLNFFVQKYASDFSISLMDQPGGLWALFAGNKVFSVANVTAMKFFVESLINLPAVRLFEDSAVMLNYTNAFVGAVSGLVVFAYMRRLFNERIATYSLIIASVYPAALNFSFFALRDIIIYFFLLMNIFSFAWIILKKDHRLLNVMIYGLSFLCATILRVTFVVFILIPPGWFFLQALFRAAVNVPGIYRKLFFGMVAGVIVMFVSLFVLVAGYFVVVHQVTGATTLVAPTVLFQDYAENRATRGTVNPSEFSPANGQGAASLYLPIGMFEHLPFPIRVSLQLVAFIDIPLPWQLTGVSRILALFDTFFVVACIYWAVRMHLMIRKAAKGTGPPLPPLLAQFDARDLQRLSFALLLAFVGSWFGFAVLVSDSGNAFRMRVSVEPFLVFGASVYVVMAMRWLEVGLKRAVAPPPAPLQLAPGE
jgi:hypothetical protein